jgi:hypothetical protein
VFLLDGGVLTSGDRAQIRLHDGELNEYRFFPQEEAQRRLRPYVWRRVETAFAAITDGTTYYLHDGSPSVID